MIVIGAGAAGLAAAAQLAKDGFSVVILEARERMGGRIYTLKDLGQQFPIELGAEFIHGRPSEIMDALRQSRIPVSEVSGDNWCVQKGQLSQCDFFSEVDEILQRMKMNENGPDESFASFLKRCCSDASADAKKHALSYVAGFNAADPAQVSVRWLLRQMHAEEKIEGDRAFRARGGYQRFAGDSSTTSSEGGRLRSHEYYRASCCLASRKRFDRGRLRRTSEFRFMPAECS